MTISEIGYMPTTIELPNQKIHESVLRSYNIMQKVVDLLRLKTPHEVIIELIEEMTSRDGRRFIPPG